eukprot:Hpha_TRINITY_DN11347_c0_g2::TRINITY_DN11347_c0_g2_i1::g.63001::m.63001
MVSDAGSPVRSMEVRMPAPHVDRVLHVARSRAAAAAQRNAQGVRRIMLPGRAACERDCFPRFPKGLPEQTGASPVCLVSAAVAAVAVGSRRARVVGERQAELRELQEARAEAEEARETIMLLHAKISLLEEQANAVVARSRQAEDPNVRKLREIFEDCTITEFVEIPAVDQPEAPPSPPPPPILSPPVVVHAPCSDCQGHHAHIEELENELLEWRQRAKDFTAKEEECRRLRTILRFSQLKKDSDRLHEVEHRMFGLELEVDRCSLQSRIALNQRSELQRLRDVEREYDIVKQMWAEERAAESGGLAFQSNGGAEPPLGPPTGFGSAFSAARSGAVTRPDVETGGAHPPVHQGVDPAAAAGVEDSDVTFGTICGRMKSWLKAKEVQQGKLHTEPVLHTKRRASADSQAAPAAQRAWVGGQWMNIPSETGQRPAPKRRQRVSSAPPGGRRRPPQPTLNAFCTPRGNEGSGGRSQQHSTPKQPTNWWG